MAEELTLERARQLADRMIDELDRRTPEVERADAYYRGEHPLRFASDDFSEFFSERYQGFSDNWCQVVTDAPVERLTVTGIQPYQAERADVDLWRVWEANDLPADSQLGFQASVSAARSFVLVWGNPEDDKTPEVTFEDASQAIIAYEPGSRRKRLAALKWWQDGATEFCTLYTADQVFKLQRQIGRQDKSAQQAAVDEATREWGLREIDDEPNPQPNPMRVVPMVEVPNRPLLNSDDPISDICGVIPMQDANNLLWALMFNAADAAALPHRIVTGAEVPKTPILNERGEVVGTRPVPLEAFARDRVLWIPSKDAKTASWPAADLKAYSDIIEVAVGHIAAQTRTPAHYLIGKMANLSGDALIAAETGLVKRIGEKQLWMGAAIREVFRLIALAQGDERKASAVQAGRLLWEDPQFRNRSQLADELLKLKTIGFPLEFLASRYGLTPPEVAQLMKMRERDAALDPVAQMMNGKPDAGDGLPVDGGQDQGQNEGQDGGDGQAAGDGAAA